MSLTPQDIVEVELRQAMRGYATADVDDLLRRVADALQARDDELADVRSQLDRAAARLAEAEASQQSVQRALVTAHAAAEQTIRQAEQDAEELRQGALRDLDVDADEARREVEQIEEEGRAARRRQQDEFDAARARLQDAYDEQRTELGERLDELRSQLVVCEGFLRDHIEEQEAALDRILDRIDAAAAPTEDEGDELPGTETAPDVDAGPPDGATTEDTAAGDAGPGDEPSDEATTDDGPDTDEIPRVDVDGALAGSSPGQAADDREPDVLADADGGGVPSVEDAEAEGVDAEGADAEEQGGEPEDVAPDEEPHAEDQDEDPSTGR